MAFSPLNQRDEERTRHRENKGRLGHAYARFNTKGPGSFEFEQRVGFGMTFVERPFISYGSQVDPDHITLVAGPVTLALPQATGFVTAWDMTSRDHYIGCWVGISVAYPIEIDTGVEFKLSHDFTFSAIALKDIPTSS